MPRLSTADAHRLSMALAVYLREADPRAPEPWDTAAAFVAWVKDNARATEVTPERFVETREAGQRRRRDQERAG